MDTPIINENGLTPLDLACCRAQPDIINQLLISGMDPNIPNPRGPTTLGCACTSGDMSVVKMIISAGGKVNTSITEGIAPIYYACLGKNLDIVQILLANWADIGIKINNETLIDIAIRIDNTELLSVLLEYNDHLVDENLHHLRESDNLYAPRQNYWTEDFCSNFNSDVGFTDHTKQTITNKSTQLQVYKPYEFTKPDYGVNSWDDFEDYIGSENSKFDENILFGKSFGAPSTSTPSTSTPAHTQINNSLGSWEDYDTTDITTEQIRFSQKSEDKSAPNKPYSATIFDMFYERTGTTERISYIEELILEGVDLDKQDLGGFTLLCYACLDRDAHIVGLLLSNGADPNIFNPGGQTALGCACISHDQYIVRMIIHAGGRININREEGIPPIFFACRLEGTDIAKILLDAGADTDVEYDSATLLDEVAADENEEMLNLLFAYDKQTIVEI